MNFRRRLRGKMHWSVRMCSNLKSSGAEAEETKMRMKTALMRWN